MDLELDQLSLAIGGRVLVSRLTARLGAGVFCCVLGKNGAGKSTLLRTVAGLRQAQGGQVLLDRQPLAQYSSMEQARRRALLSQQQTDAFSSRVIDTVMTARFPFHSGLAARIGLESKADRRIAFDALTLLGLEHLAERDVLTLSGGERRQVAIATVLGQQVALLLLDEPAAHLDLDVTMRVFTVLQDRVAKGACILASVHDPNLAARYASHVMLLQEGGQAWFGSAAELLTPSRLEATFGHPMVAVTVDGKARFIAV